MATTNPIFSTNKTFNAQRAGMSQQLNNINQFEQMYQAPSATAGQMNRMTYDDVVMKTLMCFGLVLVGATVGWVMPGLMTVGMFIGLGLGLYLGFTGKASKALTLTYALAEGLFVGGLSRVMETYYPGVAIQAIIGTFAVFAAALYFYKSGKFRTTPKSRKIFSIAITGYVVFSLLNLVLMMTGAVHGMFGINSMTVGGFPLGVIIGLGAVAMGAYSLVLDFESIDYGVRVGAPEQASWTAAFGLTMTIIWLYTEILRLLAILRGND